MSRRRHQGTIELSKGEPGEVRGPTEVGSGKAISEEATLSQIIELLNARFGTDFTESDEKLFSSVVEDAVANEDVRKRARANPLENFALAMKAALDDAFVDRMDRNQEIVTRFFNDEEFKAALAGLLVERIYEGARS